MFCSVQPDGYESGTTVIEWIDTMVSASRCDNRIRRRGRRGCMIWNHFTPNFPSSSLSLSFFQGSLVPESTTQNLHARNYNNGTVRLTIGSLSSGLVGEYMCRARNGASSNSSTTMIYGPPPNPQPGDITVTHTSGQTVSLTWSRPQQSTIITQYEIRIYKWVGKATWHAKP